MPRIRCPHGEQRGAVVYCRASSRVVNPLVLPCSSEKYEKCRYFKPVVAPTIMDERMKETIVEAELQSIPEKKEVTPPATAKVSWDEGESRALSDPAVVATIIINAQLVMATRMRVKSSRELSSKLSEISGWADRCYLVDAVVSGEPVYMKFCRGVLVASARPGKVLAANELDDALSSSDRVKVVVYGPIP